MTALSSQRVNPPVSITRYPFTVPASIAYYKGGAVALETSGTNAGKVLPVGNTAFVSPIPLGLAYENLASDATVRKLTVNFSDEMTAFWYVNSTSTAAVAATDVGKFVYFADDQTVTINVGRYLAGIAVAVDSTYGVLVVRPSFGSGRALPALVAPTLAFASNACAPADIVTGATYDVPTTAGVSTITLPAAAADGTWATFVADGTKNGHTVAYADETGPVTLTTALTASKRHVVNVEKKGGKWFASAYISP